MDSTLQQRDTPCLHHTPHSCFLPVILSFYPSLSFKNNDSSPPVPYSFLLPPSLSFSFLHAAFQSFFLTSILSPAVFSPSCPSSSISSSLLSPSCISFSPSSLFLHPVFLSFIHTSFHPLFFSILSSFSFLTPFCLLPFHHPVCLSVSLSFFSPVLLFLLHPVIHFPFFFHPLSFLLPSSPSFFRPLYILLPSSLLPSSIHSTSFFHPLSFLLPSSPPLDFSTLFLFFIHHVILSSFSFLLFPSNFTFLLYFPSIPPLSCPSFSLLPPSFFYFFHLSSHPPYCPSFLIFLPIFTAFFTTLFFCFFLWSYPFLFFCKPFSPSKSTYLLPKVNSALKKCTVVTVHKFAMIFFPAAFIIAVYYVNILYIQMLHMHIYTVCTYTRRPTYVCMLYRSVSDILNEDIVYNVWAGPTWAPEQYRSHVRIYLGLYTAN
jgi:hypothetical protein